MEKFIITEQEVNFIIREIQEAPAKYVANAMVKLKSLKRFEKEDNIEN